MAADDREAVRAAVQASITYGTGPGQDRWTLHPSDALLHDPAVGQAAGRLIGALLAPLRPALIVCTGTAGLVLGAHTGATTGLPVAIVRKVVRHRRMVDGTQQNGRAVLVDDICNSGRTLGRVLAEISISRRPIEILAVCALVDLSPARDRGPPVRSVFTRADFRTTPP